MKGSELSLGVFNNQNDHSRGFVATDSSGNTYTLFRADIADHSYSFTGTPSYVCKANQEGSDSICLQIGTPGGGGTLPGALHVSADGDIYVALAQFSGRTAPGALSTSDYQLRIKVCRYQASPFGIDTTFGTLGCADDTTAISSDQSAAAVGHIGPFSYEVPLAMTSKGSKTDNSFVLAIGVQDSIVGSPYFWSRNKNGGAPTGDYASWGPGFHLPLLAQNYDETGTFPTIQFSTGLAKVNVLIGMNFQSTGKIVAFSIINTHGAYSDLLGYRFNVTGVQDTTFGTTVSNLGANGNNNEGFLWVAKKTIDLRTVGFELQLQTHFAKGIVDDEDRILLVGSAFNGTSHGNFRVLAYDQDGAILNHTSGNSSVPAWCHQNQKAGFDLLETPGSTPDSDRIFVACTELVQPGFTYQASIWSFDSGDLILTPGFGTAGKLALQSNDYDNGSVSLAVIDGSTAPEVGRKLVFFGTQAGNGSADVPQLSRYSY